MTAQHGKDPDRIRPSAWSEIPGALVGFPIVGIVLWVLRGSGEGLFGMAFGGLMLGWLLPALPKTRRTGYALTPAGSACLHQGARIGSALAIGGYAAVLFVAGAFHRSVWWPLAPAAVIGVSVGVYAIVTLLLGATRPSGHDASRESGSG
jgi:hypothetical protein